VQDKALLAQDDLHILVSAVSIWELRVKWPLRDRLGERKAAISAAEGMSFAIANGFEIVPLEAADCAQPVLEPPLRHKDPFDEMLMAHAQALAARLLTRDGKLLDHPLAYRFE
jgi:PIN domain nuclease of toxin-antitoxin system